MLNKLRKLSLPILDIVTYPILWMHPNLINILSIIVSIPGYYFFAIGNELLGSLFILGAVFDAFDGHVARKTGKGNPKFGGILDATIDRIYEGLLLLSMGIGKLVSWEWLFALLIASYTSTFIKAKAEAVMGESNVGTNKFSVGFVQRGDRILILFLAPIANYFLTSEKNEILLGSIIFLTFASVVTLIMRGIVISKETGN